MRKLLLFAFTFLVSASVGLAQNKIETKWNCAKPSAEHKLDIGDAPDHSFAITQGACTAASSDAGFPEKTGQYTGQQEVRKDSISERGRFNVTMGNNDKVFYTYDEKVSTDVTKPAANTWKIVSGTGKYKGIKGSGTCAGKLNADGSSEWTCTGTYAIGK
jgi:hypothetical protein